MSRARDSWINQYDEVEFEIPSLSTKYSSSTTSKPNGLEREKMLHTTVDLGKAIPGTSSGSSDEDIGSVAPRLIKRGESSIRSPSTHMSVPPRVSPPPHSGVDPEPAARPRPPRRSASSKSYMPSPLNPAPVPSGSFTPPRFSNIGQARLTRMPSEESRTLSSASPFSHLTNSTSTTRASMILYRFAGESSEDELLPPHIPSAQDRNSVVSTTDSLMSLSSDSKYPSNPLPHAGHGLVPYAYDPVLDELDPPDDEDNMHDPLAKRRSAHRISFRGFINIFGIVVLLAGLISVFVVYPIERFYHEDGRMSRIVSNPKINSTGQAMDSKIPVGRRWQQQVVWEHAHGVDEADAVDAVDGTEKDAPRLERVGGGVVYELVFEDTFDDPARFLKKDPVWELSSHPNFAGAKHDGAVKTGTSSKNLARDFVQLRTPLCLGRAFIEVGLRNSSSPGLRDGDLRRALWSGVWEPAHDGMSTPTRVAMDSLGLVDIRLGSSDQDNYQQEGVALTYIRVYSQISHIKEGCDYDDDGKRVIARVTPHLWAPVST